MERQIEIKEAWPDFWSWIKQKPEWAEMSRKEKNYLFRTQTAYKKGEVGSERVKNLLEKHAPERYTFRDVVIIHE